MDMDRDINLWPRWIVLDRDLQLVSWRSRLLTGNCWFLEIFMCLLSLLEVHN